MIIWTLDWLVQNYNKDKIINKIINYEYEDSYRTSRSNIREFLGVNTDYDYYYPTYKYRSYNQYNQGKSIDIIWFSKFSDFEEYWDLKDMILKLDIDNEEYEFDLTSYINKLKEKSEIYAKSNLSEEEKNILQQPALILEKENYKLIITWFSIEEDKEWKLSFNNIRWYILIK